MNSEKFSQALEKVSDELLVDALNVYKQKEKRRHEWIRFAAVAATVAILLTALLWPGRTADGKPITAPGILKVYAYDLENGGGADVSELEEVEMKEGVYFPSDIGWGIAINLYPGLPIKLSLPDSYFMDSQIHFQVKVIGGECFRKTTSGTGFWWDEAFLGQDFVLENHQIIFWHHLETDIGTVRNEKLPEDMMQGELTIPQWICFEGNQAFIEVTVYANENIIGATLIEIYADEARPLWYQARVVKSEYYPQVEGKYQKVTKAYVEKTLDDWKERLA